jgi:hypothetical protein
VADIIRPATVADAAAIVPNLRQCDIDECEALCGAGSTPGVAVSTVVNSPLALAYVRDGRLVALFGVAGNLLSATGAPWLFGTDEVSHCSRAVIRDSRRYLPAMLALFPRLANYVDARNTISIRWLKRIGFKFHPAVEFGGLPFYPFTMGV